MSYENRVPELGRVIIAIIVGCLAGFGLASHYHFSLVATMASVAACAAICWFMVDPVTVLQAFGQALKKQLEQATNIRLQPLPSDWLQLNVERWKLATLNAAIIFLCVILLGFGAIVILFQIFLIFGVISHNYNPVSLFLFAGTVVVLSASAFVAICEFLDSSTESLQKLQVKSEGWEGSVAFNWRLLWRVCLPLPLWLVLFALKTIALAIIYAIGTCHSTARLTAMVHGVAGLLLMISTGQPLLGLAIGVVTGALSYQLLMKDQHVGFRQFATQRFRSVPFRLSAEKD